MKKIYQAIIILLGVILTLDAIFVSTFSNFNIGNSLALLLGIFLIVYGSFFDWINEISKDGFMKWIKFLIYFGFVVMLSIMFIIFIGGKRNSADLNEDAIIVLGCGIDGERITVALARRLNKATEYYNRNNDTIIVVSGGQGPQEDVTEASAMKKYLVSKGIPKEKILMEERATSTYENFKFSKEILDNYFDKNYSVAYVTNDYHGYRAGQIAKINGLKAKNYCSMTDIYLLPPTYIRETLAVVKLWVFKR